MNDETKDKIIFVIELNSSGCESCGCNTDFAVGGTCDQETGQCECLPGVTGINCDRCPTHWILVVNDTRTERPPWKAPFNYEEGCFPCSTCVSDLLTATESLNSTLSPIMSEFGGVNSSYLANRKLENIQDEVQSLMPEIELLNPQEGKRRLQPLEKQVTQLQQSVKSLNVGFRSKDMEEAELKAQELGEKASLALEDMGKVGIQILGTTREMKQIADGLGSGVTPDQIKTSIDLGNEWLETIKANDFSPYRANANEQYRKSMEMVQAVKQFVQPVEDFKGTVGVEDERIKELQLKLDDLKNNSENSLDMLRVAKTLNFRNSDPAVSTKTGKIRSMSSAAEANIQLGIDLNNEATEYSDTANESFDQLQNLDQNMNDDLEKLDAKASNDMLGIERNAALLTESFEHANKLESQALELKTQVDNAKSPAERALNAASAYFTIGKVSI